MAVTAMKVQFGYTNDAAAPITFEVTHPPYGYKTTLIMPWLFQRQGNNTWTAWDNGANYDIRKCEMKFVLSAAEHGALMGAVKGDTLARGRNMTVTFYTGSGVYPFGADRGNTGPFTCAVEIAKEYGTGPTPYKYFHVDLILTNVAAFPAYSPPAPADEGPINIGDATGLQFPDAWLNSEYKGTATALFTHNQSSYYNNPGSAGDGYITGATFKCSTQKIADLLAVITGTIRTGTFNFLAPNTSYPFGITGGTGGEYVCRFIQNEFNITHEAYNNFKIGLQMAYISGPQ